jgi:hypothetical protein
VEIPEDFICPITHELMESPVMAADGFSYERAAITRWLQMNILSPMTGLRMPNRELRDNLSLKNGIDALRRRLPEKQNKDTVVLDLENAIRQREEFINELLIKKES